jgi:hypothetical protein
MFCVINMCNSLNQWVITGYLGTFITMLYQLITSYQGYRPQTGHGLQPYCNLLVFWIMWLTRSYTQ